MKKLVSQWEFGRPYSFKIYYNEVDAIKLKNDNENVKGHAEAIGRKLTSRRDGKDIAS